MAWSGLHSGRVWGGRYLHFITVPAVSSRRVLSRILVDIRYSGEYWCATMHARTIYLLDSWDKIMRMTIDNQLVGRLSSVPKSSSRYLNTFACRYLCYFEDLRME